MSKIREGTKEIWNEEEEERKKNLEKLRTKIKYPIPTPENREPVKEAIVPKFLPKRPSSFKKVLIRVVVVIILMLISASLFLFWYWYIRI